MDHARETELFGVYVKTSGNDEILAVHSDAFLAAEELGDWTKVDEGEGLRFAHAQNLYLDGPLYTRDGLPAWRLEQGKPVARTEQELNRRRATLPPPPPTTAEKLQAQLDYLLMLAEV